jgi:hypothetical protein|tara:strand:- start:32 stop:625 length:594 start_codon:yes stop_codon:yes gene_type:complete
MIKLTDITAKNGKALVEGTANRLLNTTGFLRDELKEMIEERRGQCPECEIKGKCVECGCSYEGMIAAPSKACPRGVWKAFEPTESQVEDVANEIQLDTPYNFVVDLNKSNMYDFVFKAPDDCVVGQIELSCRCMTIYSFDSTAVKKGDNISFKMEFDISELKNGDTRTMLLTLNSTDVLKPLNNLDRYRTFNFSISK